METVTSSDGTRIAFRRSGEGSALVIVGGSLADHRFYAPLADELAERFTVYNFDRRAEGRAATRSPTRSRRKSTMSVPSLPTPEDRSSCTGIRPDRPWP